VSRYRFIRAERATSPVTILCRVLGVARSAYDAWAGRGVSARAQADAALTTQIAAVHARSRRTFRLSLRDYRRLVSQVTITPRSASSSSPSR
jgi:hypothetical protein